MRTAAPAISEKTVILDIDGTLVPAGASAIDPELAVLVEGLKSRNDVYLLSNKSLPERNRTLARTLGVPLIETRYKKPDPRVLRGITAKHPLVVVGDKLLTDGLLAAFVGAPFVRVSRLVAKDEPWLDKAYNAVDDLASQAWALVRLMRLGQWVKNLVVFAPVFFARELFDPQALSAAAAAFAAFCFLASAGYCLNDYMDAEADRAHARKRLRPIASGEVTPFAAGLLGACLFLCAWGILLAFAPGALALAALYFASSVAYSLYLKRIPIVEMVMFIWFYLARILAGAAAAQVHLTAWLALAVVFLALFLVVAKRQAQLSAGRLRGTLGYSQRFLEGLLCASAALVVVFYAVYTVLGTSSPWAVYSTLPVLGAVARYLQLALGQGGVEYPERTLVSDPGLLVAGGLWLCAMLAVFY